MTIRPSPGPRVSEPMDRAPSAPASCGAHAHRHSRGYPAPAATHRRMAHGPCARARCRGGVARAPRFGSTFRRRGTRQGALCDERRHNYSHRGNPDGGRCHDANAPTASGGPTGGRRTSRDMGSAEPRDVDNPRERRRPPDTQSCPGRLQLGPLCPNQPFAISQPFSSLFCSTPILRDKIGHLKHPHHLTNTDYLPSAIGHMRFPFLLALGEDLGSGPGDQYGVLELRRQAAVRRHGSPAVVPHVALDAPHGYDRLCTTKLGAASISHECRNHHVQSGRRNPDMAAFSPRTWNELGCCEPIVKVCPSIIWPGLLFPVASTSQPGLKFAHQKNKTKQTL
jgi:hypothetical protein